MEAIQFELSPYVLTAVSLVIVSLASVGYALRLREKTAAIRFVIAALGSLCMGAVTMILTSVAYWGGAFAPFTEAWAVLSMAALIGFSFHYPQKIRSPGVWLAAVWAIGVSLLAFALSLSYAYRVIFLNTVPPPPSFFWALNPLTFFIALVLNIRRAIAIRPSLPGQKDSLGAPSEPGKKDWKAILKILWRPRDPQTRLLRNYALALSLGLIQGLATVLLHLTLIPLLVGMALLNFSLLLMVAAIVYAFLDLPPQPPGLLIRIVGFSLTTFLIILSAFGIFNIDAAAARINEANLASIKRIQQALKANTAVAFPENTAYLMAVKEESPPESPVYLHPQLIYAKEAAFNWQQIAQEQRYQRKGLPMPPSLWESYFETKARLASRTIPLKMRYGDRVWGSYHRYAGYIFTASTPHGTTEYEIGFDLDEIIRAITRENIGFVYTLIAGVLFIVLIFPLFFRANLMRPLESLLAGVKQAEAGNPEILTPVIYQDEIGFLTDAFNKMTASLRAELAKRRAAEAELKTLNLTLEQRIVARTRELAALYDVSAAASQTQDLQTLLTDSLARSVAALRGDAGFIFLIEAAEHPAAATPFQLLAHQGFSNERLRQLAVLTQDRRLLDAVVASGEPLLVLDTTADGRISPALYPRPATLLLAILQAEGNALGIMGLSRALKRSFDLNEIALMVSIADQVGVSAQNARRRRRAQQVAVLQERQNLARDLHDSVIQSLYGLTTLTEAGQLQLESGTGDSNEKVGHFLNRIAQITRQSIREMRLFIYQLRPPDLEQEGLVNALNLRLAAVEGRSDLRARLQADEAVHLSLPVELAFYHIAQEALNNTLKHARANNVVVKLYAKQKRIILEIDDDGCGFDPDRIQTGGMGLRNMRERAAAIGSRLEISSGPGRGTRVIIRSNYKW